MGALKAHEVEGFLRAPTAGLRFFLVYGPDTGLVSERADALAAARLGASASDPFALMRLDSDQLAADPARLLDEMHTVPLFGGERLIRVRAGSKSLQGALEPALSGPEPAASLIVEAGDLKASAPLRKLFEGARLAVTLPCYPDEARDLARVIDEELGAGGLRITPEARRLLQANLGGDRLASRQEIRKLMLYCHGREIIDEQAVLDISGDVSAQAVDALIDALGLGDPAEVAAVYRRLVGEGANVGAIGNSALRHLMQLQLARAEIDRGRTASEALRAVVPPVFGKRQASFERQLVLWTVEKTERAAELLQQAVLDSRRYPAIAEALIERALLSSAAAAKRR